MKLFTVFSLIGIGILVEIVRRFGVAFVEIRRQKRAEGCRKGRSLTADATYSARTAHATYSARCQA